MAEIITKNLSGDWRIEIWYHLQLWSQDQWTRRTVGYFRSKESALEIAGQNSAHFTKDCLNPHLVLTQDGVHGFVVSRYSVNIKDREIIEGEPNKREAEPSDFLTLFG